MTMLMRPSLQADRTSSWFGGKKEEAKDQAEGTRHWAGRKVDEAKDTVNDQVQHCSWCFRHVLQAWAGCQCGQRAAWQEASVER